MMNDKDEKISWEILKHLYEELEKDTYGDIKGEELFRKLSSFDKEDIIYMAKRMDEEFVNILKAAGCSIPNINIKMKGVEKLHKEGYDTFLKSDERYEILEIIYDQDRENIHRGSISRKAIKEQIDAEDNIIALNIKYLVKKGLIEEVAANAGPVEITERGRESYEAYINSDVEIPRTSPHRVYDKQIDIGAGEEQKGENLFRDIVELAQDEIIIIDRYAREGLYEWLRYVPSGVKIKVVTGDRVINRNYKEMIKTYINKVSDIEIRYLEDKENFESHERYVIRDREDGWLWGHSFHDTGKKHHTPSELKPINLKKKVDQFEKAWEKAERVIQNEERKNR